MLLSSIYLNLTQPVIVPSYAEPQRDGLSLYPLSPGIKSIHLQQTINNLFSFVMSTNSFTLLLERIQFLLCSLAIYGIIIRSRFFRFDLTVFGSLLRRPYLPAAQPHYRLQFGLMMPVFSLVYSQCMTDVSTK